MVIAKYGNITAEIMGSRGQLSLFACFLGFFLCICFVFVLCCFVLIFVSFCSDSTQP